MNQEDLAQLVLTLEPHPEPMAAAAERLLEALETDSGGGELGDQVGFFVEEVYRIVLGWMATGEEGEVGRLLEELHRLLAARPQGLDGLDGLAPAQRLTAKLGSVAQLGALFLRTDNLARSLGALSGRRRRTWRRVLRWIYQGDRPVRASDLRQQGLYDNDNAAGYALDGLAGLGFLSKRRQGPKAVVFELTWSGRSVGRRLGEEETPAEVDAGQRFAPLTIEARGFADDRMRDAVGLDRGALEAVLARNPQLARRPAQLAA